ncbi:MAG TPA: lipid carrier--UDP-N-acetylgalactosaminyltransferase [Ruminococcaceae bacterium]|nr:lipid carrier--UDP-N-acetylgalactosaminyltransferase [Oscillospiraceae bacterium]
MQSMKRIADIIISFFFVLLLSPLLLLLSLIILIADGKPILYKQKRIGKNEKLFTIYKFRTMKNGTRLAASGDLTEAEAQIISGGKLLRRLSLDELPQLFNILKGDMSLIGPRPLIPEETEIHELRKKYGVYRVRPGLTGLAQVNGRDRLGAEEKALLDKKYVENCGLATDLGILLKTVRKVLGMSDVIEGGDGR